MSIFRKLCCLMGVLGGCLGPAAEKSPQDPLIVLSTLDISLDADANRNSATSIDLLVIYKKDLLDAVMKMSAKDYYVSALQIQRDFPNMVDVWHWELTPGQLVKHYPICLKEKPPAGAVIFADYLSPGDHRIRLGSQEKITLRLKREDFCVLELGCASDLNKVSVPQSAITKRSKSLEALEHQLNSAESSQSHQGMDLEKVAKQAQSFTKQTQSVLSQLKK